MHATKYPFALRLIGIAPDEAGELAAILATAPQAGPAYAILSDDSLQEPDLYIADGSDLKSLTSLAAVNPSELQPALILGEAAAQFPFPGIGRPLDARALLAALAGLVERRADALRLITAAGRQPLPERRRRERLDFDLTDAAEYVQRRRAPPDGAVLIIDKNGAFRDHVAKLLAPHRLSIEWTDSAVMAVRLCDETQVSVVMINTATPGVEPYALCRSVKGLSHGTRIAVVFLVNAAFGYDSERARAAGARGLLDKPVADRHLLSTLKKLLSLPR